MVFKEDIIKTKQLGNPILNSVSKIYMKSGQVYVKKNYQTIINFLKWFGLRIFTFGSNLFVVWASHRIQNEINSKKFCQKYNIATPKLIDQNGYNLFVEFIKGIPLDAVHTNKGRKNFIKAYEKMGMILAKIHNLNACIGDCKPENIFETLDKDLYILDFDQFRFFNKYSEKKIVGQLWDFHEFLFYLGHFFPNPKHSLLPKLIHAFLLGYFRKRKRNKTFGRFLMKIGSPRYIWSYLLFLNPFTLRFIYRLVTTEKQRILKSLVI